MAALTFIPLRDLLSSWNDGALTAGGGDSFLDRVGIDDFTIRETDTGATISLTLAFSEELGFEVPGAAGLGVYVGTSGSMSRLSVEADVGGDVAVRLPDVTATLRLPEGLFIPVERRDGEWVESGTAAYDITISGASVTWTAAAGIEVTLPSALALAPVMIGQSGIVIESGGIELVFGDGAALPSTAPAGFRGAYVSTATVYLPAGLDSAMPAQLTMTDAYIGSGGFTGTVSYGRAEDAAGDGTLHGFEFRLDSISISFVQNAITAGAIQGALALPWFEDDVDVAVNIGTDGTFGVTLSDADEDGLFSIEKEGLGTLRLSRLGIETNGDSTDLILGGSLLLTAGAPTLQWPEVAIDELRIDSGGHVTIAGGWLALQQPLALNLYGFALEVSEVGFGSEDDGSRWIGFSGGIRLTEALPTGASVDGMRLSFEEDWTFRGVTLEGVGVQLTIPDVLELSGDVSLVTSGDVHYFSGSARLELKTVQLTADASVIVGRDEARDYTFLYIFVGVDLPVGIPIAATGAGIFGFAGLFGMNVAPSAAETDNDWYTWYKGAYHDAPACNITHADKWVPSEGALAFGAGMTIGTLADTGWVVNAKGLIVVLIPGPVVMLNAKANLLEVKPELEDTSEGTFDLLAVLDAREGYMQLNVDAGWDVGKVLAIDAATEAYFDFAQPSLWHVYMGERDPEDKRIRADVLSLFHADSYLMIDSGGLATGFGVHFGDSWKFGPVSATLTAWIEAAAEITWRPFQAEGALGLGGEFAIGVAGFEIGVSAEALLEGRAPSPYWVHGLLALRVNLPLPLDDLEVEIELEWEEPQEPALEDPVQSISLAHGKVLETWTTDQDAALLLTTANRSPADCDRSPYVPLDARPAVTFARPVNVGSLVTLSNPATSDDLQDTIGDYRIRYDVTALSLERAAKAWGSAATWQPVEGTLEGSWTAEDGGDGSDESLDYRKLQLCELNPFAFASRASRIYSDRFLGLHPSWPCGTPVVVPTFCVDWHDASPGATYAAAFTVEQVAFATEVPLTVEARKTPLCGQSQALHRGSKDEHAGSLWIGFPEPIRTASLCLEAGASDLRVRAYLDGGLLTETSVAAGSQADVQLDAAGTEWVEVSGVGWWLARVCYTTAAASKAADWQTERTAVMESSLSSWEGSGYVFDPESYYRLAIESRATLYEGSTEVRQQDFGPSYVYFQTGGPPALIPCGVDEPAPQADAGTDVQPYPFGGGLTDLTAYVRWTFPEHGATAAYRAYDPGVEFNETYVEQMYGGDLADMSIRLLDANGQAATDAEGHALAFDNAWGTAPAAELSTLETRYIERVTDCCASTGSVYPPNETITAVQDGTSSMLQPRTLYRAQLTGTYVLFQDDESAWSSGWPATWDQIGHAAVIGLDTWDDYRVEVSLSSSGGSVGAVVRHVSSAAYIDSS